MKKIKNLFATPKKAVLTSLCVVAVVAAVSVGTVHAASAIAKSSAIGEENAINFACADAGVDPAAVQVTGAEFDREQGQFVYEVEFISDNVEYEYWIRANDGAVVKKEMELLEGRAAAASAAEEAAERKTAAGKRETAAETTAAAAETTKAAAESSADAKAAETTAERRTAARETTAAAAENKDSAAGSKSSAAGTTQAAAETTRAAAETAPAAAETTRAAESKASGQSSASSDIGLESAKSIALSDAGLSASAVTITEAKREYDDGILVYEVDFYTDTKEYDYEIHGTTGEIIGRSVEALPTASQNSGGSTSATIGVDQAKAIAAGHAGVAVGEISFSKAKLENDDGITVYEVEFYRDMVEYEYTIDAFSGTILEYSIDQD